MPETTLPVGALPLFGPQGWYIHLVGYPQEGEGVGDTCDSRWPSTFDETAIDPQVAEWEALEERVATEDERPVFDDDELSQVRNPEPSSSEQVQAEPKKAEPKKKTADTPKVLSMTDNAIRIRDRKDRKAAGLPSLLEAREMELSMTDNNIKRRDVRARKAAGLPPKERELSTTESAIRKRKEMANRAEREALAKSDGQPPAKQARTSPDHA